MRSPAARIANAAVPRQVRWRWCTVALLLVVGLCGAMALAEFVESRVAEPACRAYATGHGLAYAGIEVYSVRQDEPGPHCLFTDADGGESTVWLQRIVSFITSLWVGAAMDIELSTPALSTVIALLWMAVNRALHATARAGGAMTARASDAGVDGRP